MSALAMMGILLIAAAILLALFLFVWKRDKSRSEGVARDDARLDPEDRRRTDAARRNQGPDVR